MRGRVSGAVQNNRERRHGECSPQAGLIPRRLNVRTSRMAVLAPARRRLPLEAVKHRRCMMRADLYGNKSVQHDFASIRIQRRSDPS